MGNIGLHPSCLVHVQLLRKVSTDVKHQATGHGTHKRTQVDAVRLRVGLTVANPSAPLSKKHCGHGMHGSRSEGVTSLLCRVVRSVCVRWYNVRGAWYGPGSAVVACIDSRQ